jgi:hypothetical protein
VWLRAGHPLIASPDDLLTRSNPLRHSTAVSTDPGRRHQRQGVASSYRSPCRRQLGRPDTGALLSPATDTAACRRESAPSRDMEHSGRDTAGCSPTSLRQRRSSSAVRFGSSCAASVPMDRMQRVGPSGASAVRPQRASDTRASRRLQLARAALTAAARRIEQRFRRSRLSRSRGQVPGMEWRVPPTKPPARMTVGDGSVAVSGGCSEIRETGMSAKSGLPYDGEGGDAKIAALART